MAGKLIQLDDGSLLEIDVPGDQVREISGGLAYKVDSTFNKLTPLIKNACEPVILALREMSKEVNINEAEIEIGLGFEAEGNAYVTQSKTKSNMTVRIKLGKLE